jgi:hypothetical protein
LPISFEAERPKLGGREPRQRLAGPLQRVVGSAFIVYNCHDALLSTFDQRLGLFERH